MFSLVSLPAVIMKVKVHRRSVFCQQSMSQYFLCRCWERSLCGKSTHVLEHDIENCCLFLKKILSWRGGVAKVFLRNFFFSSFNSLAAVHVSNCNMRLSSLLKLYLFGAFVEMYVLLFSVPWFYDCTRSKVQLSLHLSAFMACKYWTFLCKSGPKWRMNSFQLGLFRPHH